MRGKSIRQTIRPLTGVLFAAALLLLAVFAAPARADAAKGGAGGRAAVNAVDSAPFVLTSTLSGPYTVTFAGDNYTPQDSAETAFTDDDSDAGGIQVTLADTAILKFKIAPAAGYTVTGVSVATDDGATAVANLYGPDADGIYTVSNVKADTDNQVVTVATAESLTLTYDANGGTGATVAKAIASGQSILAAFPADIGITPPANQYFAGWNTASDGSGTPYAAGESITVSENLQLYARWTATAAPFTAMLCETGASTGTELTEGGATGELWNYKTSNRMLRITGSGTGKEETLSITLPRGMAFVSGGWTDTIDSNITGVSFAKYNTGSGTGQQGVGDYSNDYTGTLTYTIAAAASSYSVNILVAFDQNLWNNRGYLLTGIKYADYQEFYGCLTGENPPITVKMGGVSKTISRMYSAECQYNFGVSINNIIKTVPNGDAVITNLDARGLDGYWKSLTLEFALPNVNGVYATYVREGGAAHLNGMISHDSFTIDTSDPTKLVYSYTGLRRNFASENCKVEPILNYSGFADEDVLDFSLTVTAVDHAGNTFVETNTSKVTVLYPKPVIKTSGGTNRYVAAPQEAGIYYFMGTLSLKNEGFLDSGEIKAEYNFETSKMAVAALRLPIPVNAGNISVSCTLVDANGTNEFTHTMPMAPGNFNDRGPLLLARDVAIAVAKADPDAWSLKKVEYIIPSIPASTNLFGSTAHDRLYSGNYYGRLTAGVNATATLKAYQKANASGLKILTFLRPAQANIRQRP